MRKEKINIPLLLLKGLGMFLISCFSAIILTIGLFISTGLFLLTLAVIIPDYDPVQQCERTGSFDGYCYCYQEKLTLDIWSDEDGDDSLNLLDKEGISFEILRGQFVASGWYDDVLYIVDNDANFYSIDIDACRNPKSIYESADEDFMDYYDLVQYTEDEFKKAYPNYKDFDWELHIFGYENKSIESQKEQYDFLPVNSRITPFLFSSK